jgi:hypothetical protein
MCTSNQEKIDKKVGTGMPYAHTIVSVMNGFVYNLYIISRPVSKYKIMQYSRRIKCVDQHIILGPTAFI